MLFTRDNDALKRQLAKFCAHWPNRRRVVLSPEHGSGCIMPGLKLGRGELFEALGMLSFFREQVLGPMLFPSAPIYLQRGVRQIEALGIDPDGLLTSTLWQHARSSLCQGLPFEGLLTLMSICGLMRCLTISQTMRRVGRSLPCWMRILPKGKSIPRPRTRPVSKRCCADVAGVLS